MLEYLVTSKVRRRLLTLFWHEDASGSASALAKRAHVAFAGVHRELRMMKMLGLVTSVRVDGAEVFCANKASTLAEALRTLVKSSDKSAQGYDEVAVRVRGALRTLGAPLFDPLVPVEDVETTLVQGVVLSHQDPTVARVVPLSFYGARNAVDPVRLLKVARDNSEKQAVGFFLDLTGVLSGDARFKRWAKTFRDRRQCASRSFFPETSVLAREAAECNALSIAKKWGLRMNMDLDVFQSMYEKHHES